jgi:hypothetical protein
MRRTWRSLTAVFSLIVFTTWSVHSWTGPPDVRAQDRTPPAVELKKVKYGQLCEAVQAQRGKIVVVDIWAFY